MFQQRYGVPMQDGYQKSQPDAGRFNFQDRMAGGPGMRLGQLMAGHPMTGGPGQIQPMPQFNTGGQLPPMGGYDSGGINPGGMYTGLPPMQSGYPANPMLGGQLPPQGLAGMFNRYRGF